MKAASVNVQDNPDHPIPVILAYLYRVAMYLGVIGFVGFQEITDQSDKAAVRKHFPATKYHHLHFDTATPIVVRKKNFRVIDSGRRRGIDGRKGYSPDRDVVWVDVVKRRAGKWARSIRFANWHNINGAWNGRFPAQEAERQRDWNIMHGVAAKVALQAQAKGYHFVFTADHNREKVPGFSERQKWLVQHGIDKIGAIPAYGYGVRRTVWGHMQKGLLDSHPSIWVAFVFFPKRK